MHNATDPLEKERMADAADFAFRQAWALCPYMPETVYGYVNFLLERQRLTDAIFVVETATKMPEKWAGEADQFGDLLDRLKERQKGK